MSRRWRMYALSIIGVLMAVTPEANAIICPRTQIAIGGTCIARPGSVIFDVSAQGEGCHEDNFFGATIAPLPGATILQGVVFCSNKPGNVPSGSTGGFLTSTLGSVAGVAAINDKQECRGQIDVEATQNDLINLTQFCKSGHVAVSFSPLAFQGILCINDTSDPTIPCVDPIDSLQIVCVHPSPNSIVFNRKLAAITGDPYQCARCIKGDCASCVTDGQLNGTCPVL